MGKKTEEFLQLKNECTRRSYKRAFDLFREYGRVKLDRKLSGDKLIRMVAEDRRRNLEDRERPEERILKGFYNWLKSEAPQSRESKRGFAEKTCHAYLSGIIEFLRYNGLPVNRKRLGLRRPTRKRVNRKMNIRRKQIRKLIYHAKLLRDKAIILCLWQSGMSVGDLLSLNVGDILVEDSARGSLNDPPLLIKLNRRKASVEYRTLLGRDACNALKKYLDERERLSGKLGRGDPLFVEHRKRGNKGFERLKVHAVDTLFRRLALRSGLVSDERMEEADHNPARPHALRAGFSSVLKRQGVNKDIVEGLMGHQVDYDSAYHDFTDEELRELYKEHEDALSIEQTSIPQEDEIREAVRKHFGELGVERVMPELENTLQRLDSRVSRVEEKIEDGITDALLGKLVADPQFRDALEESIVKVAREIVSKPWKEFDEAGNHNSTQALGE